MSSLSENEISNYLSKIKIQVTKPVLITTNKFKNYKLYNIRIKDIEKNTTTVVARRFSDFSWLYDTLKVLYSKYLIPKLPEKNLLAKFDFEGDYFIETRRRQLENFIKNLVIVDGVNESIEVVNFLTMDIEKFVEWKKGFKILADVSVEKEEKWQFLKRKVGEKLGKNLR